jgi:hypothetical protein
MKNKILMLVILSLASFFALPANAQTVQNNPAGKWKFEAPYAPEGFTSGTIEVALADNNYSTSISFTGNDFKIPGEKTKVEKDTLSFTVFVEGNEVAIQLKMEDATKMSGKAHYSEGEIPLTLTKDTVQK